MLGLETRVIVQSVAAVAVDIRMNLAGKATFTTKIHRPSRNATTASFPWEEMTVTFTFPSWM